MLGFGGRRRARARRAEPRFDAHPDDLLDLRLSPADRIDGGTSSTRRRADQTPAKRRLASLDDFDDDPPPLPRRRRGDDDDLRAAAGPVKSAKTRRAGRAGEAERPARGSASRGGRGGRRGGNGTGGGRGGRPQRRWLRRIVMTLAVLALWCAIAGGGLIAYEATKLPPIDALKIPPRPPSVTVLASDGSVLARRGEGGRALKLADMPPYLPQAFIAIEDRRFYSNFGIDPIGLARALVANLRSGGVVEGGSTITQQLAKNLFLTPERSLERKLQEAILAVWLETKFTKNQILALYLNRVYFGDGAYGVDAAAERYFGHSATKVTLGEAAILAGLVKAPSRLAPSHNLEAAKARGRLVLHAMVDTGAITGAEAKEAALGAVTVAVPRADGSAGYVADWVMDQLNDLVGEYHRDLVVDTTVDPVLQADAEQAVVQTLGRDARKYRVGQGALVSLATDGAVKALVGGRSYAHSQYDRAVTARRQPGSAFKPFVYLTALEHGYRPNTVVQDAPIRFKGWKPEDFEHKYRGPVSLTEGLALSLNTVAVRLALAVGPKQVVDTAYRLGITSQISPDPSIALGTSEVSPLELAGAYVPFANGGFGVIPYVVRDVRVAAGGGKVLYRHQGSGLGRVASAEDVGMMNWMMSRTIAMGTGSHAEAGGWQAAGKTGTSQDFRDAWFVGYTAKLVTAVWVGNDDDSPTKRVTGGTIPVAIWSQYMTAAGRSGDPQPLPGNWRPAVVAAAAPQQGGQPAYAAPPGREEVPAIIRKPLSFLRHLFGG